MLEATVTYLQGRQEQGTVHIGLSISFRLDWDKLPLSNGQLNRYSTFLLFELFSSRSSGIGLSIVAVR